MNVKRFLQRMIATVAIALFAQVSTADEGGEASAQKTDGTQVLAKTPPLGWNSWDGYGTTINEEQFNANAKWFAEHLKPLGWEYVTIDMEWFVTNPTAEGNSKNSIYALDANGRYIPAKKRLPQAVVGKEAKPLD